MANVKNDPAAPPPDSGMTTVLVGDAAAIGQDTFTSVQALLSLVDNGKVSKANGDVTVISIADPSADGTVFVIADADVTVSSADKIHIKTSTVSGELNGVSYEMSVLTFKAFDKDNKDDDLKVIFQDKSPEMGDQGDIIADIIIELDGNTATAIFDAQASGDNSLVIVDASVLAIEDEFSASAVMITSVVS